MGSVDVAITVQQMVGTGDGSSQRPAVLGIGSARSLEQARRITQITGHDRTEIGGLRQSAGPVRADGTQLGRAEQFTDHGNSAAAPQVRVGHALQQGGDLLIGFNRRLGQMPDPPLGLAGEPLGQFLVRPAALITSRHLHDSGPDQRMAEKPAVPWLSQSAPAECVRRAPSR